MSEIVNLYQAKTRLSSLVERAMAGEDIIIAKAGKPKVKLVAIRDKREPRKPSGLMKITYVADDFDAPLPPEIQRYFDGEDDEDFLE